MGREISGNGNFGCTTHDRQAQCIYALSGAASWRRVFLLSCAELPRYGDDIYETAELCRAGQFFSHPLRRYDGTVAVLVSQELLSLLHVRRLGNLSRAGL